jgi:hypothetical protein
MFYLVTYATHSQGYFDILQQSCPDLVVLGMGTTWHGLYDKVKGVLDFCHTKSPKDIVCFVDGFDSVVLTSLSTIHKRFLSYHTDLVFSKAGNADSIMNKYLQDKLFGRCSHQGLNTGMYIGYVDAICTFWETMQPGQDDQWFATQQCIHHVPSSSSSSSSSFPKMVIDDTYQLFYNYSTVDEITIQDGILYVHQLYTPCILSGPHHKNLHPILSQLGYTHLPEISIDISYRIQTYLHLFLPEIVCIFVLVGICWKYGFHGWTCVLVIMGWMEISHYELYVKHKQVPIWCKIGYMMMDILHTLILVGILYLLTNYPCNLRKLLLLNVCYGLILFQFFIFHQCCLTMIENWFLDIDPTTKYMGYGQRLQYWYDPHKEYLPEKGNNLISWMQGNLLPLFGFVLINTYCFYKIYKEGCGRTCRQRMSTWL